MACLIGVPNLKKIDSQKGCLWLAQKLAFEWR